jgi:hypothetical protein
MPTSSASEYQLCLDLRAETRRGRSCLSVDANGVGFVDEPTNKPINHSVSEHDRSPQS